MRDADRHEVVSQKQQPVTFFISSGTDNIRPILGGQHFFKKEMEKSNFVDTVVGNVD